MFPYTVKDTESEYDIQSNYLLYKIDQPCQSKYWMFGEQIGKKKTEQQHFLFCNIYKLHNSYFVTFVIFVFL